MLPLSASPIRHLSTKLPQLPKIPYRSKSRAIKEAQKALTDYLQFTRSLPFIYADLIARNSLFSLSNLISSLPFSPSSFSKTVQRHLRYYPINEFEFFFESIGIDYTEVRSVLPLKKFFFYEDARVFDVARVLEGFGIPWNRLGIVYKEERSVFRMEGGEVSERLSRFKKYYGFSNSTVSAICLAFPWVLSVEKGKMDDEVHGIFSDLKQAFGDFDVMDCVEGNVDARYEICRKVRVFYDLGCEKGKMGEMMGRNIHVFLEYPHEILVRTANYFSRFAVEKKSVGLLILENPDVLSLDLETPISVVGLLKYFGLSEKDLKCVYQKYPHVLGRNRMANLPNVMRAMNLHEWFFGRMRGGGHVLLASYALGNPDEDVDKEFKNALEKIQFARFPVHTMSKLDFLHGIGFGENFFTRKVLAEIKGTGSELQERFDCLINLGIEFSKLCSMLRNRPNILNQKPQTLEQKVSFFRKEVGPSLDYLESFPSFLNFDLETRIKPRYRFYKWLREKGLCTRDYSLSTIVSTSENYFVNCVYGIHPAAPKVWFECFSLKKPVGSCKEKS